MQKWKYVFQNRFYFCNAKKMRKNLHTKNKNFVIKFKKKNKIPLVCGVDFYGLDKVWG